MKFNLKATFYAEDIDDAFEKLGKHFTLLAQGSDENSPFDEPGTVFDLKPNEEPSHE